MKINIEHIEERMFDYYEGNLSEQEKTDLLNLIHQHPEYEVEFTRWAQSYAHVDHSEPDYGLTTQLLKKPVLSPYLNKYTIIVSFILLITGTLAYVYTDETKQVQEQSIQTNETIQSQNTAVGKEQSNTVISTIKPAKINPVKANDVSSGILLPDAMINQQVQSSASIADTTSLQTIKTNETIGTVNEKQQVDTLASKSTVSKPNTAAQEKKKVKHKTKVTLKPSSDFIPTNPNF
ncbi:hypothetical protein [Cytophaga aurantiaca]|uniref:hypothetical protein n=1 Tax=Cytophaga aurantiaca TaxID=29530 RepID=UPI00039F3B59|nr:hypothetical protein [Cytophaga aurantiaca]